MVRAAVFVISLLTVAAQSGADPSLPSLPNFFSGYAESITLIQGLGLSVNTTRSFYDVEMDLARGDLAGNLDSNTIGMISYIQDTRVGVLYAINRQYNNCTTTPLPAASDLYLGKDSHYKLRNLNDLFLFSAVNYTYAGNMSAHGVMLDNWVFNGNFSHGGYNYTNAKLQWSITQPGQDIAGTSSINTTPIPWRLSLDALVTYSISDEPISVNISTVSRYFDLTFEEPSFDVFDTSVCVDAKDALFLVLAVPTLQNGTDIVHFRASIRAAVSNYTQLYPIQVGDIQITNKNETFIFVSLQISNLTSVANVTDSVTAQEAYQSILDNAMDGQAPFQIKVSSRYSVTPYVFAPDSTQNCGDKTSSSMTPTSSEPVTSLPGITTTVTVTSTITACSTTVPCSVTPSVTPTVPATCPPSSPSSVGVPKGRVVGIAFATLFTGSILSCIGMVMCFICYRKNKTRMWSPSIAGYEKQPDTVTDKEYFQ